ncbi:MAG: hypothetical protein DCC67_06860, partial [Planctomycetota bacterium]
MNRPVSIVVVFAAAVTVARLSGGQPASAQAPAEAAGSTGWQPAASRYDAPVAAAAAQPLAGGQPYGGPLPQASSAPATSPLSTPAQGITPTPMDPPARAQVRQGDGTLPSEHGQIWREYDITPYTIRSEASQHPEQAIVDWILRETGYEAWHATPVGLLSADRQALRCYHTPQMQAVVADIVDRFVSTKAQAQGFGLRIITLKNPNWRTRALPLMTSIPVQSPGVQGWIMAREDAALLLADLRQRTDFREHSTAQELVLNGQTSVVSTVRPLQYVKGVIPTRATWPGYQPEFGQ